MALQLAKICRHEYVSAGLALAAVTLLCYGVIFMGYTLSPASLAAGVLPSGPYGYTGREIANPPILDIAAAGSQTFPMHRLVVQYILSGTIPLWNPYQAAGAPFAADTSQASVYAPVTLLHVLPVQLWDLLILLRFWIAGISTYAFVRVRRLSIDSAFVGSVLFMLSGAFVWHSSMDHLNVIMLTPLILLAVERIIAENRNSTIIVAGLIIMLSILGAHIESLILQFLFVLLYFIFRAMVPDLRTVLRRSLRFASSYALGFGFSAFFVGPAIEYLLYAFAGHAPGWGLVCVAACLSPYLPITTFVPYFFGQISSYAGPYGGLIGGWTALGGYIGTSALFLSLIGIVSFKRMSRLEKEERRFAIFFFAIAVLALMKSYGVPPVQWIGYLPLLDLILFPRYLGFAWAFGFSMAAAVGFEKLTKFKTPRKDLLFGFAMSLLVLVSLASFSVPTPLSPGSLGFYYAGFNLTESFLFLGATALLSLRMLSNKAFQLPMICLIILEMAAEIPMGLSFSRYGLWQAYRGFVIIISLVVIMVAGWRTLSFNASARLKAPHLSASRARWFITLIILVALITENLVAGIAPQGLPQRTDPFARAPYISYLQSHAGLYRVYSYDNILLPDWAGVFGLYDLGTYGAFNVASFHTFAQHNLDSAFVDTVFASNEWFREPSPPALGAIDQMHRNLKFYDFLGVKYFITGPASQTTFNDLNYYPELVGGDTPIRLDSPNFTVGQTFVAALDNLSSIAVQLGPAAMSHTGYVLLTLDSTSHDPATHRSVLLPADTIPNAWPPSIFTFQPITNSLNVQFSITLSFPNANSTNAISAITYSPQNPRTPLDSGIVKGHMLLNREPTAGLLVFGTSYDHFRLVYSDIDARVYQNPGAMPRAFLVHRFTTVNSLDLAQSIVAEPSFDLTTTVVLDGNPTATEAVSLTNSPVVDGSTAEIVSYQPNQILIDVDAQHPALLILTDVCYPGWSALVDGKPERIFQADGLVRAVFVPAGVHTVEFTYFPLSFEVGLSITLASAVIALFTILRWRREPIAQRPRKNSRTQ